MQPFTRTFSKPVALFRAPLSADCPPVSTASMAAASQVPLPSHPTHPHTPTVLPVVTGPPSQLPMASQRVHGALQHPPAGRPSTDLADQADLVVELSDSVADLEGGAHNRAVHSLEAIGALVLLDSLVPGQPVHGQSGGTEPSAQLLTGLAGPPAPGLPAHRGLPGLPALLRSLLLPSTRLHLSEATLHTPPPASATRLHRPLLQALPLHKPLAPAVLPPSPLQVVRQLLLLWASSPCYESMNNSGSKQKNGLSDWHFLRLVHSLQQVNG
jgi:hypothetical protein